jgi:hypothetical protein
MILISRRRDDDLATGRDQLTLELAILSERKSARTVGLLEPWLGPQGSGDEPGICGFAGSGAVSLRPLMGGPVSHSFAGGDGVIGGCS